MSGRHWIPGVIRKELPRGNDPDIIVAGAIFHVAVAETDSLYGNYKTRTDGIESTGYIRYDGTIEQYRPVTVRCDAQWQGNEFGRVRHYGFTSWETEGLADGKWTPEQLDSIKKIILFHHHDWTIPLRQAPAWNRRGFGYHSLFEEWNHNHHTCPGPRRIAQWRTLIEPHLAQWAAPTRIELARTHLATADELLTQAIEHGRGGHVRAARNALRTALAAHPLPQR